MGIVGHIGAARFFYVGVEAGVLCKCCSGLARPATLNPKVSMLCWVAQGVQGAVLAAHLKPEACRIVLRKDPI